MRKLVRFAWPVFLGVLGGLVAAEAELAYELNVPVDYGCVGCKGGRGIEGAGVLVAWILVGFVGPALWLLVERARVVARSLAHCESDRLRRRAALALVIAVLCGFFVQQALQDRAASLVAPWMRLVSPDVAVFITATLAASIPAFALVAFDAFRKRFALRLGASVLAAAATFVAAVVALGMHLGPI